MPHTPGPWTVETVSTEDGDQLEVWHEWQEPGESGIDTICDVVMDYQGDTPEANARLIAAAPSLLGALQWLLDDMTDAGESRNPETGEEYDSVAHARAVLLQATEQPDVQGEIRRKLEKLCD